MALALLVLVCLASIAIGAKALPLADVWHGLFHYGGAATTSSYGRCASPGPCSD